MKFTKTMSFERTELSHPPGLYQLLSCPEILPSNHHLDNIFHSATSRARALTHATTYLQGN
jgi:hypothetical protein